MFDRSCHLLRIAVAARGDKRDLTFFIDNLRALKGFSCALPRSCSSERTLIIRNKASRLPKQCAVLLLGRGRGRDATHGKQTRRIRLTGPEPHTHTLQLLYKTKGYLHYADESSYPVMAIGCTWITTGNQLLCWCQLRQSTDNIYVKRRFSTNDRKD
jgi:hypothetical protein